MKSGLREILAKSHIAAIAIAVLLLWSLGSAFRGLSEPFLRVAEYLFTAAAIRSIPFENPFSFLDRVMLFEYLFNALAEFTAAWFVARWVYGQGPLRGLGRYRTKISRRTVA